VPGRCLDIKREIDAFLLNQRDRVSGACQQQRAEQAGSTSAHNNYVQSFCHSRLPIDTDSNGYQENGRSEPASTERM
jgi:hypothetical protein